MLLKLQVALVRLRLARPPTVFLVPRNLQPDLGPLALLEHRRSALVARLEGQHRPRERPLVRASSEHSLLQVRSGELGLVYLAQNRRKLRLQRRVPLVVGYLARQSLRRKRMALQHVSPVLFNNVRSVLISTFSFNFLASDPRRREDRREEG